MLIDLFRLLIMLHLLELIKFKLVPNGGGFNLINSTNNQTIGLVSKENAVILQINLSQWEQTVTAVKAGMAVDENAVKAIQQNVATKLAQLSGSTDLMLFNIL